MFIFSNILPDKSQFIFERIPAVASTKIPISIEIWNELWYNTKNGFEQYVI